MMQKFKLYIIAIFLMLSAASLIGVEYKLEISKETVNGRDLSVLGFNGKKIISTLEFETMKIPDGSVIALDVPEQNISEDGNIKLNKKLKNAVTVFIVRGFNVQYYLNDKRVQMHMLSYKSTKPTLPHEVILYWNGKEVGPLNQVLDKVKTIPITAPACVIIYPITEPGDFNVGAVKNSSPWSTDEGKNLLEYWKERGVMTQFLPISN